MIKSMKKIEKNSLMAQLLVFTTFTLLFLALAGFTVTYVGRHGMRQNTIHSNHVLMQQTSSMIERYYHNLKNQITAMSYTPTVVEYIQADELQRLQMYESLQNVFLNHHMIQESMIGVALFDLKGQKVADNGIGKEINFCAKTLDRIRITNVKKKKETDQSYVVLYYPIYNLNTAVYDEKIGTSAVAISTDIFFDCLGQSQITEDTQVILKDTNGMEAAVLGENRNEQTDESDYVARMQIPELRWELECRIPTSQLWGDTGILNRFVIITFLIAGLMQIMWALFCYFYMIKPIQLIDLFVKAHTEHTEERLEPMRRNEIGLLAENLNQMLDEQKALNQRIEESRNKMYQMKLSQKQMEILAYRNQINPHFLYNTFECICGLALYHGADDVAEITSNLSEIFRYAVKGGDWVAVRQELEYIRKYARIIEYRFSGRISIELYWDEEVMDKGIIKLLLQPIVENAVFHGCEPHLGKGFIKIEIKKYGAERMKCKIQDNGCGMAEEYLQKLRKKLSAIKTDAEDNSIGLENVCRRLELYYGDEATIKVESAPEAGTSVTMILPVGEEL